MTQQISAVSTVTLEAQPNVLWVLVETGDGLTGLGETFFLPATTAAYVHEVAAPYLLGRDPFDIAGHWRALYRLWSRKGVGAEARGASAVDIALWDLYGRQIGQPLHRLLGGRVRESIRVYNTCVGPRYQSTRLLPGDSLFGPMVPGGHHEDMWAFEHAPAELAASLLEMGVSVMKVVPFDATLALDGGQLATRDQILRGIDPLARIRDAHGDRMEIAVEMRSHWLLPAARRIIAALEDLAPLWVEDPIRNDDIAALADLRASTTIPIAAGENIGSRNRHRELIDAHAVDIVLTDAGWNGGVSECRRVADLAASAMLPFGVHDCTGPVGLAVGTHLAACADSAFLQEIVRAYYYGWYSDVVEGLPVLRDGWLTPSPTPGHGVTLADGLLARADCHVRRQQL